MKQVKMWWLSVGPPIRFLLYFYWSEKSSSKVLGPSIKPQEGSSSESRVPSNYVVISQKVFISYTSFKTSTVCTKLLDT